MNPSWHNTFPSTPGTYLLQSEKEMGVVKVWHERGSWQGERIDRPSSPFPRENAEWAKCCFYGPIPYNPNPK